MQERSGLRGGDGTSKPYESPLRYYHEQHPRQMHRQEDESEEAKREQDVPSRAHNFNE